MISGETISDLSNFHRKQLKIEKEIGPKGYRNTALLRGYMTPSCIVWFKEYKKTLRCSKCLENEACCLDFHHLEKRRGELCVSEMARKGYPKEAVLAEIEKCIVLCSNCHRKEHNPEFRKNNPVLFGPSLWEKA